LALATPIASLIGISWGAKRGILFKEAKFIETFAKADIVVFDKTGTLTEGNLTIKKQSNEIEMRNLAPLYALVDSSTHPVSRAIKFYLAERYDNITEIELEEIEQIHAQGVVATYQNRSLVGGNSKLLSSNGIDFNPNTPYTLYHFAVDSEVIVSFELEDSIKERAKETIEYLTQTDTKVVMATGDNQAVATRVAKEIGIDNLKSEMTPIDKSDYIDKLKEQDRVVVMVGDGINDALALSKADVAIAMGKGADVALAISDIVILNDSLRGIRDSFMISRRTYKFIKQNLGLSLVYNILTIPVAMVGFVIPLVAALSMSLSSLIVVGNSMRIKIKKSRYFHII
jgi:Cu+-exporting ATPase